MRVYCSECKYCKMFGHEALHGLYRCMHQTNLKWHDTSLRKNEFVYHIQSIDEKNENNDCICFKKVNMIINFIRNGF